MPPPGSALGVWLAPGLAPDLGCQPGEAEPSTRSWLGPLLLFFLLPHLLHKLRQLLLSKANASNETATSVEVQISAFLEEPRPAEAPLSALSLPGLDLPNPEGPKP